MPLYHIRYMPGSAAKPLLMPHSQLHNDALLRQLVQRPAFVLDRGPHGGDKQLLATQLGCSLLQLLI
jgi:hypothetical protein